MLGLYALLALLVYVALFPLLSWVNFSDDDGHIMRVAVQHGWLEHYFSRDAYRELSVANYTPVSLTMYRALTMLGGVEPTVFLGFMLLLMSVYTALAASLVRLVTASHPAAIITMALLLSNLSFATLLTRFYTMHYVIGGIFALLALLVVFRRGLPLASPWTAGILVFLAILSKEVYLVLPVVIAVFALRVRHYRLLMSVVVVTLVYIALRQYILGVSVNPATSGSYFSAFWSIGITDWISFLAWYASHRFVLLVMVAVACLLASRSHGVLIIFALLFGLPGLTVPHGILQPEMHADRIFLAMDTGLAIASAIILAPRLDHQRNALWFGAWAGLLVLVFGLQASAVSNVRSNVADTVDHRFTEYLLENWSGLEGQVLFAPLEITQGNLMWVSRLIDGPDFEITLNCQRALDVSEHRLRAFDRSASPMSRETLADQCLEAEPGVDVLERPGYYHGVIRWQVRFSEGYSGGVLLLDRAMAIPFSEFRSQVVRPGPGERYQLFARQEDRWWFSEVDQLVVID